MFEDSLRQRKSRIISELRATIKYNCIYVKKNLLELVFKTVLFFQPSFRECDFNRYGEHFARLRTNRSSEVTLLIWPNAYQLLSSLAEKR